MKANIKTQKLAAILASNVADCSLQIRVCVSVGHMEEELKVKRLKTSLLDLLDVQKSTSHM